MIFFQDTWRKRFEKATKKIPHSEREGLVHTFGQAAAEKELSRTEKLLGNIMPKELRSLLSEFNGVVANDGVWEQQIYLNTNYMVSEVPEYLEESGNPVPPNEELNNVVFFAQQNGFAVLYGICVRPFSSFKVGQILSLDHETGEFETECRGLKEFVSSWRYCLTT